MSILILVCALATIALSFATLVQTIVMREAFKSKTEHLIAIVVVALFGLLVLVEFVSRSDMVHYRFSWYLLAVYSSRLIILGLFFRILGYMEYRFDREQREMEQANAAQVT